MDSPRAVVYPRPDSAKVITRKFQRMMNSMKKVGQSLTTAVVIPTFVPATGEIQHQGVLGLLPGLECPWISNLRHEFSGTTRNPLWTFPPQLRRSRFSKPVDNP